MSTSTDLVPVDLTQLPSTQVGSDGTFNELAKSGDYLGRLQLYTKGKAIDKGLIRPGHYGIPESADDIVDLGDTIDIIPLARRPKAIDMSDKEAIIVCHDHESDEFKRIAAQSLEKESHCMYGPSRGVVRCGLTHRMAQEPSRSWRDWRNMAMAFPCCLRGRRRSCSTGTSGTRRTPCCSSRAACTSTGLMGVGPRVTPVARPY